MDNTTIIRIIAGCFALGILAIGLVYIAFLGSVLKKCSPPSRMMSPGLVWLLLIPLFSIVWNFFVVIALADSLGDEFRLRNIPTTDPKPGKSVGIAMAVCGACMIIPFVNILAILPEFILWVFYWVKMAEFSRRDSSPIPTVAVAYPPGN